MEDGKECEGEMKYVSDRPESWVSMVAQGVITGYGSDKPSACCWSG